MPGQDPIVYRQQLDTVGNPITNTTVAVTNKASGGAIGTAAATVDVATIALVNQTTASQTLTVPDPTTTTAGKTFVVCNVGSQSFTMLSLTVTAGRGLYLVWTGAAWNVVGL